MEKKRTVSKQNFLFLDAKSQTTADLSANTPRKARLKEDINFFKKREKCKETPETHTTTLEDVIQFIEKNYPAASCKLLKAQLNLLNKAPKGSRYSNEFKQFALSIYFLGPRAYKKMSSVFRLPSKTTLTRFSSRWVVQPGFNDFIFGVIGMKMRFLKEKEKDCILCVDEISLKSHLFYDISKDKIIGFQESHNKKSSNIATSALVVMARGIATRWKQPIAYFFYETSAPAEEMKEVIFESIRKLDSIGLQVHGIVSDQGPNFQKLFKATLMLTEDNPVFHVDNKKIVYIFDVPHLLKSTRNNFFKYNFVFEGNEINIAYLETMYQYEKLKAYRLAPRLTDEHIYPNNFQKMKVKLASQIFSHSVTVALNTYVDFKVLPVSAIATASFIGKMNSFFDVLNSCSLLNYDVFMGTEKQVRLLEEMSNFFVNVKAIEKSGKEVTNRIKCFKGWQITIKSILLLWESLKDKGYTFLFTRNLNQDCLENYFGQIRNCSGNARNPTPIQFTRAFRKLFALKYLDQPEGTNCLEDFNEILINLTPDLMENSAQFTSVVTPNTFTQLRVFTNDYKDKTTVDGNALVYVTGYLMKKCQLQHTCDVCNEFNNSNNLEEEATRFSKLKAYNTNNTPFGGLLIPQRDVVDYVTELETIFVTNFNELAGQDGVGMKLKQMFQIKPLFFHPCQNFPFNYFLSLYTRMRIYHTIKYANRDIKHCKSINKPCTKLNILKNL